MEERNHTYYVSFSCFNWAVGAILSLSAVTAPAIAANAKYIEVNLSSHQWKAVDNGYVVRSGRASGGKGYCPDIGRRCVTPTGQFRVLSKGGPGCKSSRYPVGKGGAPMPYCMFFSKNYGIHGSYDVPNYNASHGCVRIVPADAKWLSGNFATVGTPIRVRY